MRGSRLPDESTVHSSAVEHVQQFGGFPFLFLLVIPLGGGHVGMPGKLLNRANVGPGVQQFAGVRRHEQKLACPQPLGEVDEMWPQRLVLNEQYLPGRVS